MLHHLKKIGGNLYDENEVIGTIQGVGEDTICIISPDMESLLGSPVSRAEKVPTPNDIFLSKTKDDIKNLKTSDTCAYTPQNIIPVPPFLIDPINEGIESSNGDTTTILLTVIQELVDFDDLMEDGDLTLENARTSCIDLVYWLYLCIQGKIYCTTTLGSSNREIQK